MDIISKTIEICKLIQQIPAPTFEEEKRAKFVFNQFKKEGLSDVHQDIEGSVYGYLPGMQNDKFIVLSAHLDTVFPSDTNLEQKEDSDRIYGAGIGDNSLGVAGLFGLLWMIEEREERFPGGIWFVANVCEEGLGDLRGMRKVVDKFGSDPLAYLILEGTGYKQIYHRGLGVKRYEVSVKTEGGHSWGDYGKPSAIHEISNFVSKVTKFKISNEPRTSMNVGIIEGGTSINTIASDARVEIDLRSEDNLELNKLASLFEEEIQAQNKDGVTYKIKVIGERPSGMISEEHSLVKIAKDVIISNGGTPNCTIGSTDANIPLSQGYPAITLGLTTGGGVHTIQEYIDVDPIEKGIIQVYQVIERIRQK